MVIGTVVQTKIIGVVDIALYVMIFFVVALIFRFFFVEESSGTGRGINERGIVKDKRTEEWTKWISDKGDKRKHRSEKKRKKNLVAPAKSHLVSAQKICDEVIDVIANAKSNSDRRKIISHIRDFNHELHSVWGYLRVLHMNVKTKEDKEYIKERLHEVEATKEYVSKGLKGKLPKKVDSNWLTNVAPVVEGIKKVRGMLHNIWNQLEGFHG